MTFGISGSSPRLVADDLRSLAIRQAPGHGERVSLQWRSEAGEVEASATLEREDDVVMVLYRWREAEEWHTQRQTIGLRFDHPPFGGRRRFWRCPGCELGARKLYDVGACSCREDQELSRHQQRSG